MTARHVLFEGMIFVPTKPVEVGVVGLMVITVLVVVIMLDQSLLNYFEFFLIKYKNKHMSLIWVLQKKFF